MRRYKETKIEVFLKAFRKNYLPNKKDTVKQCVLKSVFLILIVTIIGTSVYFVNYYSQNVHEKNLILQSRTVFEKSTLEKSTEHFLNQNSEYKAWLKLSDTELSNPVYQSKDNKFYLNHNQLKESSNYGALFFDYRTNLSDKNLVIYGNAAQDGKMFGVLKRVLWLQGLTKTLPLR